MRPGSIDSLNLLSNGDVIWQVERMVVYAVSSGQAHDECMADTRYGDEHEDVVRRREMDGIKARKDPVEAGGQVLRRPI